MQTRTLIFPSYSSIKRFLYVVYYEKRLFRVLNSLQCKWKTCFLPDLLLKNLWQFLVSTRSYNGKLNVSKNVVALMGLKVNNWFMLKCALSNYVLGGSEIRAQKKCKSCLKQIADNISILCSAL